MNKLKTIIYLTIGSVLFASCGKNFLQVEPLTKKTEDTYFLTPQEAEESLVGCYDALQKLNGLGVVLGSTIMGDNCFAGSGNTDGPGYPMLDELDPSVAPAYTNAFEEAWQTHYKAMYRCNMLISKIEQIDWTGSEDRKGELEAEARFIRAFLYFNMARMWERVPLLTIPSTEYISQANPDETYKLITEDLLFAIEYGDDTPYASIPAVWHGHANKWVAQAMLARVFLYYTGYYQKSNLVDLVTKEEVLDFIEDCITNSGYSLVENFYDIWPASSRYMAVANNGTLDDNTYAGETNKENMFAIRYTYTGSWASAFEGPDWMDDIGLRKDKSNKYGYGEGWGIASVIPDFYNSFAEGDLRKESSIIGIDEENIKYSGASSMQEYTGYFIKKYTIMCDENGDYLSEVLGGTGDFQFNQFVDFVIIRFADVLLMAAELGSVNALNYFNLVHERAGLDPVDAVDKDAIFEERRFEFAFEGIRYWDLLRYDGKDKLDYAANALNISTTVLTSGNEVEKTIEGNNIKNTKGLFQIPQNEIDLSNGTLSQNGGWQN